jgi:outer membrane protein OmpA-like peptidoglycan-associated protein
MQILKAHNIFILTSLFLFISHCFVFADNHINSIFSKEKFSINIQAGKVYNFNNANVHYFKNGVSCGTFSKGSGSGLIFNLALNYPLNDFIHISLGASYIDRSSRLSFDTNYLFRNYNDEIKTAQFETTLEADLHYFEIQPDARLSLITTPNLGLRCILGVRIFSPLKNHFVQREAIVNTTDAFFVDKNGNRSSSRLVAEGEIGNISKIGIGSIIGLHNSLKLSESLTWTQQISFDYNFTPVAHNLDWRQGSINFMTGLAYRFNKIEPKVEIPDTTQEQEIIPEEIVQTVVPPNLTLKSGKFDGEVRTGDEFLATAPLVNAVFFDKNKATLPKNLRFNKLNKEDYFKIEPTEQYYYILPRVVEILKENPQANVTLEGATAGTSFEEGGLTLAKNRAENIKEKLIELGANKDKIQIKTSMTPRFPSNSRHIEGIEENQRVDIILHNAYFQEYTSFIQFAELVGKAGYYARIINSEDPGNIYSMQADSSCKVPNDGKIYEYFFNVNKRLEKEKLVVDEIVLATPEITKVILDTIDLSSIPHRIIDTDYSKFKAIIRFTYNSSQLSEENKQLLQQLIQKLPENCTIQILGSADALGGDAVNRKLSDRRSKVTRDYINELAGNKFNIETGINTEKFDENTPVGRFLNRCIIIRILR